MHVSRPRITALIGAGLTALLMLSGCCAAADSAETEVDLLPAAEGETAYPLTLESP